MDVPGYAEAVAEETRNRNESFLGFPEHVCGFELRPLTARDWLLLTCLDNFFAAGNVDGLEDKELISRIASDACSFIWLQCITYDKLNAEAKREIETRLADIDFGELHAGLSSFVELAFSDMPPSRSGAGGKSYWALPATIVHRMAKTYGWTRADIESQPLKVVWQLWKVEAHEANPKGARFNPSDAIITEYLRTENNRN